MRLRGGHLVEVLAGGVCQRVLEHLHLAHELEVVVVWRHGQHQSLLDVQQDLSGIAVVSDESVESVAVGHPLDQPRVRRERHHRVPEHGNNCFTEM